jgi:potassium-transporting ATPase KdpC subunit
MFPHLRANLLLVLSTFVVCAMLYPLTLLAIGQGLFPTTASGSLVMGVDGKPVGSRLIAQEFKADEWFQPRPSAVGYTANASGGSNLGANNLKFRERVVESLKSRGEKTNLPVDAITTSGSGLDPHITLKNAEGQLDRVATAWATKSQREVGQVKTTLDTILKANSFEPLMGLAGSEPLVNVLEVNLEVQRQMTTK